MSGCLKAMNLGLYRLILIVFEIKRIVIFFSFGGKAEQEEGSLKSRVGFLNYGREWIMETPLTREMP